ncbi:MAG: fluoride efflux transporter FluC [Microbacterium sp.]
MSLIALALVTVCGGVGAGLRWTLDQLLRTPRGFPWAIMAVNVTGCFAMALIAGTLPTAGQGALLGTALVGLLGGYTTFSTVNADAVELWRARRRAAAIGNAAGTLALCTAAAAGGLALAGAVSG